VKKVEAKTIPLKDGSVITIREAEPSDAKALLEAIHQASGESDNLSFGVGEFDMTEADEAEFLKKCQAADNQLYLVAVAGKQIIGSLHFASGHRPRTRHSGDFGISLLKDYWGVGLGALFLDELIHWAKGTGFIKKIKLTVRTDNERAIRLYKAKGFVLEGTLTNEMLIKGEYYDLYSMGLLLR
jgi:RimJ/RimL family protein N-acetyltransferase